MVSRIFQNNRNKEIGFGYDYVIRDNILNLSIKVKTLIGLNRVSSSVLCLNSYGDIDNTRTESIKLLSKLSNRYGEIVFDFTLPILREEEWLKIMVLGEASKSLIIRIRNEHKI